MKGVKYVNISMVVPLWYYDLKFLNSPLVYHVCQYIIEIFPR